MLDQLRALIAQLRLHGMACAFRWIVITDSV